MSAARQVDDAAVLPEHAEVAPIEDAARFTGERQQADERVGDAEHRGEIREALHAGHVFRTAAEAGDIEAERDELRRGVGAEYAHAEDANGAIGCKVLLAAAPLFFGLLRAV